VPAEHRDLLRALRSSDREHLAEVLEDHIIGTSSSLLNRATPRELDGDGSAPSPAEHED
jgi:DNA-binding GntR family transcriptional regulator